MVGLRVLDLSRYLPGPALTRILADLGAEVIRVEPLEGDPVRYLPPAGAADAALNWNKRAVALDLKHPDGVALCRAMAGRVDVLVESFRPGVLDRLGLGYATLAGDNPRLIVCSLTGYGQTGPLRDVPGHDLNYQARAGVLALTGPPHGPPAQSALQLADLGGGSLTGAVALLAALLEREQTGRGRHLDVSLTHGLTLFTALEAARRSAGEPEPRGEGLLSGGRPAYRLYETRDRRWMALAALEPKFFATFCAAAGCPHLAGAGLTVGEEGRTVARELEEVFRRRTLAEWVETLAGTPCCCEPVLTPEEAAADEALALGTVQVGSVRALVPPLGAHPPEARAPALGEHGVAVMRRLGIAASLVDKAVAGGALLAGAGEDG